ncbi:hypothetical protein GGX14DRAFT_575875 [Mycena pura]|uniref:Uncharacterized protein n=1 Tax=Mycena pura TaxID=153505 RepID=A0AAD6UYB9_9AGAR|nr:hypothetical protein GGX14DRAFT_575875 [Mycena pura]
MSSGCGVDAGAESKKTMSKNKTVKSYSDDEGTFGKARDVVVLFPAACVPRRFPCPSSSAESLVVPFIPEQPSSSLPPSSTLVPHRCVHINAHGCLCICTKEHPEHIEVSDRDAGLWVILLENSKHESYKVPPAILDLNLQMGSQAPPSMRRSRKGLAAQYPPPPYGYAPYGYGYPFPYGAPHLYGAPPHPYGGPPPPPGFAAPPIDIDQNTASRERAPVADPAASAPAAPATDLPPALM